MIDLRLGNILERSPRDESVDLTITSPPYNLGKNYDESINLMEAIVAINDSMSKNSVFCFQVGNHLQKGEIIPLDILTTPFIRKLGWKLINRVVWHFGHGLHCRNKFSHRHEIIMIFVKGEYTFNLDDVRVPSKYPNKKHYKGPKKGQLSGNPLGKNPEDVWSIPNIKHNHPEKTEHPCQFPEALAERLVKAFSNQGDKIMDPFMGSGTTGVVSQRLERDFIGIDNEPAYIEIAKKRMGLNNV